MSGPRPAPAPEPAPGHRPPRLDVVRLIAIDRRLLLTLVTALTALVLFAELPGRPYVLHVLQKLAHPGVFGVVAVALLVLLLQRPRPRPRPLPVALEYLAAFGLAVLLGGLTELGQAFTHRDPTLRDVFLDARGACCALLLAAACDQRCRRLPQPALVRAGYALAGAALAVLILVPLGWAIAGYANRGLRFPVLFAPASRLDLYFVSVSGRAPSRQPLPAALARGVGEQALRVPLGTRAGGGFSLDEPSPDWRGYRMLRLDLVNPGRAELALELRVQDHGGDGGGIGRLSENLVIPASTRQAFRVPLGGGNAPVTGHALDLGDVASLSLVRTTPAGARELWVGRIELSDEGPPGAP